MSVQLSGVSKIVEANGFRRTNSIERASYNTQVPKGTGVNQTTKFLNSRNASLLAYFKSNSDCDKQNEAYGRHDRPDLTAEFRDLIAELELSTDAIKMDSLYGWSIAANRNGVIFAWVSGTHDFFLRIRDDRVDAACDDGARVDHTYPTEWLNFYVLRLGQNWREILKRWMRIAYEDSFSTADS